MSDDKTRILTADEAAQWVGGTPQEDDKTRVLSADEAARVLARAQAAPPTPADREPKFEGDKIVFFCANGHRIAVDRGLAGKRGNCSKQGCGVPVEIPFPPDVGRPDKPTRSRKAPRPAGPPAAPDAFTLADAAAPAAADPAPVAELDFAAPDAHASGEPPAAPEWGFVAGPPEADMPPPLEPGLEPVAAGWTLDIDQIDNPTARLLARLWMERAHGGIVEVHLSGGSVIMPEWYDPRWSCGTHALFAALAADDTVTLTAVAWDQIQKVVVRQVQGTPDGMFEG